MGPLNRQYIMLLAFSLIQLAIAADSDVFSYSGCYQASSLNSLGLSAMGQYTWQSPSYCQQQCPGATFVALSQGGDCYCAHKSLNEISSTSESYCNKGCNGWPQDMCGDETGDYMNVYVNNAIVPTQLSSVPSTSLQSTSVPSTSTSTSIEPSTLKSSSLKSSSLKSSSIESSSTSTKPSTTSVKSTKPTKHSSQNSVSAIKFTTKIITRSVITTSNKAQRTVVMTATSVIETTVPTASMQAYYNGTLSTKSVTSNSLSGGAIAGIVVGSVVGAVAIVALIIFYFIYTRHHNAKSTTTDIEESKQYQPYSFGDQDANPIIIPDSTGYLNHGSIKSKLNPYNNASSIINNNHSTSTWKLPSRSSTKNNSTTNLNNNNNASETTKRNPSIHSTPTLTNRSASNDMESNHSQGNVQAFANPTNLNQHIMRRSQLPSTVFEEPSNVSFYDGVQRFSTSSLPDMMEQRINNNQLRIVNPDDSSIRLYENTNSSSQTDLKDTTRITEEEGDTTASSDDIEKY
ncbi:hypothetical protein MOSE0_N02806 [Monosporozyma servazzii]